MITNTIYKPRDKTNMDLKKYKRYHDFKGCQFLITDLKRVIERDNK